MTAFRKSKPPGPTWADPACLPLSHHFIFSKHFHSLSTVFIKTLQLQTTLNPNPTETKKNQSFLSLASLQHRILKNDIRQLVV